MNKPNVLLIMTDQHRFDHLGCMGHPTLETPYMDWIASEGTLFTSAYTPSPSCIPARACLMTGQKPWKTGILGMGEGQGPMGTGFEYTIPSLLGDAGYHTVGIGKMHFYPQRSLNGFHETRIDESGRREDPSFMSDYEEWFQEHCKDSNDLTGHGITWNSHLARPYHLPEYLHPTVWTANEALDFLKKRDPSKPFFMKLSFARPHSPYDAPPYYFNMYENKELTKPVVGQWSKEHEESNDAWIWDSWEGKISESEVKRARAGYCGSINHIDHQMGRVLAQLRKEGLLDDTLIIFTSDHGDMLGDHHLWRKTYAYEGSAHIPMIIRLPRELRKHVKSSSEAHSTYDSNLSTNDMATSLIDVLPTIMDILDIPIPEDVDGISLFPYMQDELMSNENTRLIHGEHCNCYHPSQEMQFITDGHLKYIWFTRSGKEQLFDLYEDPAESTDLSCHPDYTDNLLHLRSQLIKELEERGPDVTNGQELYPQTKAFVSPHYQNRLDRSPLPW